MMDRWLILAVVVSAGALVVFALSFVLLKQMRNRKNRQRNRGAHHSEKSIDLSSLTVPQLAPGLPKLQVFGMDSTLAVLVLAPRGNSVRFPTPEELHKLVDRIVPGFSKLLDAHQPVFRRWEPQMSFEGFTHAFAYNMQLPGDKGKGTQWATVCGKMSVSEGQLFVGVVCHFEQPSQVGQFVVEHEGKWSDTLRVT